MQQYSDEQLLEFIKQKESAALRELYNRYVRLVYSFAMKSKRDTQFAGEIVQLVFTRLWTTERGFDPAKGKFINWLLTMTRNIVIDQLRKERNQERHVPYDELLGHMMESSASLQGDWTQELVSQAALRDQLAYGYRFLSQTQMNLLHSLYWEGYTLSEIADRSGEPLGTIKSRLHQALKTLRKHLQHGEGSEQL